VATTTRSSRPRKAHSVAVALAARRAGATMRAAAAAVGVHLATLCRWQAADPALRRALADAATAARVSRAEPRFRPVVPWHPLCPVCRAAAEVRSAWPRLRFWRCSRWPRCPWASWRPRAPRDCAHCGAAMFWSHSRKSVNCGGCGVRILAP
jgi:hypothetical protein